ncbi:hypothetical protein RJ639_008505 [Escallonia herrerae]|uniref:Transposase (putative) gypsy type domain-containing protein n=1 Tax=Escallonia herrerae TaxID=1293975 RepID=A0AA88VTQ5_9ASTE|nr:hypothetical protein RJ639_008505 [Escallonia herrerae]
MFGHNSVRPLSLCSERVFGRDYARAEFCSATVTLFGQSVRTRFRSGRFLFGHDHSVRAECSDTILLGQDSVRPLPWFPPRVSFSINVFERELRIFKFLYSSACDTSKRVPTLGSEVGTSNPQLPLPSTSQPFQPSSSQPLPPSSSQPSHSLSRKNALGDVKDQADDKANPKPWYTADEKSGKMSTEDLPDLIREYPLPEGWYARLLGLQEPANYGTKFETVIYEEQVKSGYRLPLHPFALRFFEHYRMAPGQLVPNGWRKLAGLIYLVQTSSYKPDATDFMRECSSKSVSSRYFFVCHLDKGELLFDRDWNPFCKDFKNPGKPTPNNLTKHILSHVKLRGGLCIDKPLSEEQLEWAKIIPPKPILAGLLIPSPSPAIPSSTSAETRWLAEVENRPKEKAKGKLKEKRPTVELPPAPKRTRVTPSERSPRILEQVSIDDDPIFQPRRDDLGMPDSQVSEQHLLHGILPRDKEMYARESEMLSRFEMVRQVVADEAQQKREAVKEAQETSHRAEELSKQGADHLAQIRKAAEEVTKARDQGILDFLDGNAGDEWLKKWTNDGLEIYELGFAKAKEMFVERFPDISLDDFVLPAVISPSRETVLSSEAGDAAASHPPVEGPSGDAPEP